MKRRALISVSDKTGVIELAVRLERLGYEIVSTGGTASKLAAAGVRVVNISDVTGFPECLDGRLKTLHPKVHGGILAMRSNPEHMSQLEKLGITPIDIVAINLYPFKQTILKEGGVELEEAIENIDIGGPTMIRAAAKNWQDVAVLIDPSDYEDVLDELEEGGISRETKFRLAAKVFEHTAHYDAMIAQYLREERTEDYPELLTMTFEKAQDLRYGENSHQKAAFYREVCCGEGTIAAAEQIHGKELSFNNINDANAAIDLVKEFDGPCAVAVKHANPCGVGTGDTIFDAYINAYEADSISIYGGIVALNRQCGADTAAELSKIFLEIIIAPSYTDEALEILTEKKNIRLLTLEGISEPNDRRMLDVKKVGGGLLVQSLDCELLDPAGELRVVTSRAPTDGEMEDLLFAWKVSKYVKSNGIVLAKGGKTVGIGPGQTNRVTAIELAVEYAGERAKGAVLASDAYFPFPDNVEAARAAGITAVIQPGGSIRDDDSIKAADEAGIAMVFTGIRHFRH